MLSIVMRFVSLLPLVLMVLSLIAAPAWAQGMANPGDGETGPADPEPADPGDDGEGNESDEGEMGPFHRPNPGHNPDSTMPARRNQAPEFPELVEAVSKGLGFEGETGEAFRKILLASQAEKIKAHQAHQRQRSAGGGSQLEALAQFLTEQEIKSIQALFSGLERYKQQAGQLARMRQSGALSQADHDDKRSQLNALAEQFISNELPADGLEGFLAFWRELVAGRGAGGEEKMLDEIGKAYGMSITHRMKFKLVARSRQRVERNTDKSLQETLRAIDQRQNEQLQTTLTPDQMQRLGILHQTSEGYKAAMRELQQLAGQPDISREELAEQKKKIEQTVRQQFKDLLVPEHYGRFMDVWERAVRSQIGR